VSTTIVLKGARELEDGMPAYRIPVRLTMDVTQVHQGNFIVESPTAELDDTQCQELWDKAGDMLYADCSSWSEDNHEEEFGEPVRIRSSYRCSKTKDMFAE
jgi:hypothetical protein